MRLSLQQFIAIGAESFCLIDIRSRASFIANHIQGSINLHTKSEILQYLFVKSKHDTMMRKLDSNYKSTIPLIICFSSLRAKSMAQEIQKNLYYLDCGIMELDQILQSKL